MYKNFLLLHFFALFFINTSLFTFFPVPIFCIFAFQKYSYEKTLFAADGLCHNIMRLP